MISSVLGKLKGIVPCLIPGLQYGTLDRYRTRSDVARPGCIERQLMHSSCGRITAGPLDLEQSLLCAHRSGFSMDI